MGAVILRAAHSNDQWAQWYKNIALALGSGQHRRLTLTPELPAVWEAGEHQLRSHTPQRSPASLQHTQLTDTDSLRAEPQAKCGELLREAEEITTGGLILPVTSRAAFDLAGLGKSTFTKEGQLEVGRIPSAAPSSVVVHYARAEMQGPLLNPEALREGLTTAGIRS